MSDLPQTIDYTVDELRDKLRNTDPTIDPELHWQLTVAAAEAEWQEKKTSKEFKARFPDWFFENDIAPRTYHWVFEHGHEPRDGNAILNWWEDRRLFWNRLLSLFSLCSLATYLSLLLGLAIFRGAFNMAVAFGGILGIAFFIPLLFTVCGVALVLANLAYYCFMSLDVGLSAIVRPLDWKFSVLLYFVSLSLLMLVIASPTLWLLIGMFRS